MAEFKADTGELIQGASALNSATNEAMFSVTEKKPNTTSKPWKGFDEQTNMISTAVSRYISALHTDVRNILNTGNYIDEKQRQLVNMIEQNMQEG
jgi:hypothetical protein